MQEFTQLSHPFVRILTHKLESILLKPKNNRTTQKMNHEKAIFLRLFQKLTKIFSFFLISQTNKLPQLSGILFTKTKSVHRCQMNDNFPIFSENVS
jgi:hypothetical protein